MNKLAAFMKMEGMSCAQAAKALGVHRSVVHKMMVGEARVSAEMAVRLSEAFGGSAWSWYEGQAMSDIEKARAKRGEKAL